jgi:signal peptidase II
VRVLILSGIIVFCDQLTKLMVKGIHIPALGISWNGMPYGSSRPILGDFFRLTYIENPGMAFGIDVGGKLYFSIFSLVASIAIIYYLYRTRRESMGFRISLAMILGGAVGNLIDRVFYGAIFDEAPLFYGKVVDFFDIAFFHMKLFGHDIYRWPVFNIADASVTLGVILLLFTHRATMAQDELPVVKPGGEASREPQPPVEQ